MSLFNTYQPNRTSFKNVPSFPLGRRWSRPVVVVALLLGALLGALSASWWPTLVGRMPALS